MIKSSDIRNTFIDYYKKQGHSHVGSSSLIPENEIFKTDQYACSQDDG